MITAVEHRGASGCRALGRGAAPVLSRCPRLLGALPGLALLALAWLAAARRSRRGARDDRRGRGPAGGDRRVAAVRVRVVTVARTAIPANDYGICSGMPGATDVPQRGADPVAGAADRRPRRARTGGRTRSRSGTSGPGPGGDAAAADPDEPWMRLEMVTTNVTNRRAERLPWASGEYYFDGASCAGCSPSGSSAGWRSIRRRCQGTPVGAARRPAAARTAVAAAAAAACRGSAGARRHADEPLVPGAAQRGPAVARRLDAGRANVRGARRLAHVGRARIADEWKAVRRRAGAGARRRARARAPRGGALLVLRRRHLQQLPRPLLRRVPARGIRRSRSTCARSTPTTRDATSERENVWMADTQRRRHLGLVVPVRRRPRRVPGQHRAHDAEPRRRGADAAARLPRPRRPRQPDRRGGRDEPDDGSRRRSRR